MSLLRVKGLIILGQLLYFFFVLDATLTDCCDENQQLLQLSCTSAILNPSHTALHIPYNALWDWYNMADGDGKHCFSFFLYNWSAYITLLLENYSKENFHQMNFNQQLRYFWIMVSTWYRKWLLLWNPRACRHKNY